MNTNQASRLRRHDIDALRVLAFSILIVYHVAMFYVADWGWHVKSAYEYQWIKFPMLLVNQWRMPLLFLVSGIASSFLISKFSAAGFIKSRSMRLLIPFIAGVILVVPPQPYIQALANGTILANYGEMTYGQFLMRYFSFQEWPAGAFDGSDYGFTWNHLWFIPYLFTYTLLLVPLASVLRVLGVDARFKRIGTATLLLFPVLVQIMWQLVLDDETPISHALVNDWYAHAMYATFFFLGYLISDNTGVWEKIVNLRWISLIGGLLCYCTLIALLFKFNQHDWPDHLAGIVATMNQWLWLLAVLAWCATLLNKPRSWLGYANNCVYPWYILHQTITVVAAYFLAKLSLGGPIEFVLLLAATVLGCWAITEFIIRRQSTLKFLFGMK